MTRNGKIARLPQDIRAKLNDRLADGKEGRETLAWLNRMPAVREILKAQFGGAPISKQNLSEWRQGGYQEWLRHEEARDFLSGLGEQADDLLATTDGQGAGDRLAAVLAVDLARTARQLMMEPGNPQERWKQLKEVLHQLGHLRREDHRAARLHIEQERWELERAELDRAEADREEKEARQGVTAGIRAAMMARAIAPLCGSGEKGEAISACLMEAKYGLEPGTLGGEPGASQTQSNPVKPDLSESGPSHPVPKRKKSCGGKPDQS